MVHALLPAVHLRGPDPDPLPQLLEIPDTSPTQALVRGGVQLTLLPVRPTFVRHRVVELNASQELPRPSRPEDFVERPLAARCGYRRRA